MMYELRYLLDDLKIINKALDDPTVLSGWYRRYHSFRALTLSLIRVKVAEVRV